MENQENVKDWHLLADRFVWYDVADLSKIPEDVTDEQIKQYLFTYHGDGASIDEIKKWRKRENIRIDDSSS